MVLVTGAGSGIGRATVHRLVEEGATVVATDVAEEGLASTAEEAARPDAVIPFVGDVTDPAFGPAAVALALEHDRLDTVVNSAGILRFEHTHDVRLEDWQRILDVNLTGTFLTCQAALPALLDGGGAIVNVASTAALAGSPMGGRLLGLQGRGAGPHPHPRHRVRQTGPARRTRCARARSTRPSSAPSTCPTGPTRKLLHRIMSPVGMADPRVVAAAIAYLGSDDAQHVNGADLRIDGGTHS